MESRWQKEEREYNELQSKMHSKLRKFVNVTGADPKKSISLEVRMGYAPEVDEFGFNRSVICLTSDEEITSHNFRGKAPQIIKEAFGSEVGDMGYESGKHGRTPQLKVAIDDIIFRVPNYHPTATETQQCVYVPLHNKPASSKPKKTVNEPSVSKKVITVESDDDMKRYIAEQLAKRKAQK